MWFVQLAPNVWATCRADPAIAGEACNVAFQLN